MPDTTSADRRRDPVGHLGSDGGARDDRGDGAPHAALRDLLGVRAGWRVLVIGASSGRTATLLTGAVGDRGAVIAVEADPDVAVAARRALVTGRVPARVEVGDGATGWPAAAPFDAVVATAGVDRVPRAWFDQLRPGGRLLAPIHLSPVASRSDAVVTLRKATSGFDQVAVMPGRVPPLRRPGGPDGARGRPARIVAGETDSCRGIWAGSTGSRGRNHADDAAPGELLVDLAGPALAGLDRGARQRLAVTAMGFGRSCRVRVGPGALGGLVTYAALALPEHRLVEISRAGGTGSGARRALGVVDAVDGGLAALVPDRDGGGVRLDAWGGRGAERALLSAVERWMLAGRPGIGDARVTVRYGPVRPHGWWSVRRGDQWVALDWRRPLLWGGSQHWSRRVPCWPDVAPAAVRCRSMDLAAFQQLMIDTYGERDRRRGVAATVAWLTEELGELAQAVRKGDRADQVHEVGDVLAWLASLAGQLGVDLDEAAARYAAGCPRCGARPCACP